MTILLMIIHERSLTIEIVTILARHLTSRGNVKNIFFLQSHATQTHATPWDIWLWPRCTCHTYRSFFCM